MKKHSGSDGRLFDRGPGRATQAVLEVLRPVLEDAGVPKSGQNLKYDLHVRALSEAPSRLQRSPHALPTQSMRWGRGLDPLRRRASEVVEARPAPPGRVSERPPPSTCAAAG